MSGKCYQSSSSDTASETTRGASCRGGKECRDCCKCEGATLPSFHESCPPRDCYKDCQGQNAREIYAKYKSAVVRVTAEFQLTTSVLPTDTPLGPTPTLIYSNVIDVPGNLETLYAKGNGFFTSKHVIVCPSHLVLLPPNYTLGYNRWPFSANQINPAAFIGATAASTHSQEMTRANRIFVDVIDVNGSKHAFTYEATLLGVSGVGDVALLYIDVKKEWNYNVPCIKKCHPHFRFGSSRKYRAGMDVFVIGDPFSRGSPVANQPAMLDRHVGPGISAGVVVSTRITDTIGQAQQELIAADVTTFSHSSGLPFIDKYGHVVGMQTMASTGAVPAGGSSLAIPAPPVNNPGFFNQVNGDGLVAGPSQYFLIRIIKILLCALSSAGGRDINSEPFVTTVVDPVGDYLRYLNGFLGFYWNLFAGEDYMAYTNANTGAPNTFFNPLSTVPPYLNGDVIKEVIGLKVLGVVTTAVTGTPVNNTISLPDFPLAADGTTNTSAPLQGNVGLNDVITHADDCPLGGLGIQIPISLVLFRKRPNKDKVRLVIRTGGFNSTSSDPIPGAKTGYTSLFTLDLVVAQMPVFYDWAWYAYPQFPFSLLSRYATAHLDFPLAADPASLPTPLLLVPPVI